MKIDVYSDIACPWCYIGQARFERALADFGGAADVEVRYRPYQLDPRAPSEAVPMLDYLARRFGPQARAMADRVIDMGRAEGLVLDYDDGLAENTLNAHRLLALVEQERGRAAQRTLVRRLFDAHFAEGRDVGDPATLAALAGETGMDTGRVRAWLETEEGTSEVRAEIAAAQRLGVSAVPTYVFDDRYVLEGAQPPALFLQALQRVAEETTGNPAR